METTLVIQTKNGDTINIPLSDMQTAIVIKILGLKIQNENSITCYSDEQLKRFLNLKSNPLKLKELEI